MRSEWTPRSRGSFIWHNSVSDWLGHLVDKESIREGPLESIYHKPINAISWGDIESFCEQRTPEGHLLDYKQDFPRRLENTIAAMANTWGGLILIGVKEDKETKPQLPLEGIAFERGLPDQVTNTDLGNITPAVLPEIGVATSEDGSKAIIIVRVHPSHQTPHAIRQNTRVYFRTGNRNNPEELADVERIRWLLNGRQKSQELLKFLYEQAQRRFDTSRGMAEHSFSTSATLTLSTCPLFPKEIYQRPPELRQLFYKIRVKTADETFEYEFPPAAAGVKTLRDGVVATRSDKVGFYHTELNGLGLFFYKEIIGVDDQIDSMDIFWRLDDFLDSAILFYAGVGYRGPLEFRLTLDFITGKELSGHLRGVNPSGGRYTCIDPVLRYGEVLLGHYLNQQKDTLIGNVVDQIGWAYNWEISFETLAKFYDATRRR